MANTKYFDLVVKAKYFNEESPRPFELEIIEVLKGNLDKQFIKTGFDMCDQILPYSGTYYIGLKREDDGKYSIPGCMVAVLAIKDNKVTARSSSESINNAVFPSRQKVTIFKAEMNERRFVNKFRKYL